MSKINTYWIHDMFNFEWDIEEKKASFDSSKTESSTVIENNWITLAVDMPDSAVNKIAWDPDLISKSVISKIDYLLLTHLDSDHVSGIDKLLWWKVFWEQQKLNIIAHPENFEEFWDRIKYGFSQNRTKSQKEVKKILDYINFIPLEFGEEAILPDFWTIKSFDRSTYHSPDMPVTAFKVFDEQRKNIANFSADTKIDHDLIEFLKSDWSAPIIHEIWAYAEGSHSHTHINELIDTVTEKDHSRFFWNHIPVQMEDLIKEIIEDTWTDIRFANKFYPESKKKEVELAKIQKYFYWLSMNEIKEKIPEILSPKVVVFSGSFDPWTYGHEAVVRDYLKMNPNSKVKVVIWVNPGKKWTFSPEQRKILIEKTLWSDIKDKVEVEIFEWIIADYVYENWYSHIIKWIRDDTDFVYEKDIASLSKRFSWDVMTSFIPQIDSLKTWISSSSLKALSQFWWDVYADADPIVREALRMKTKWQWIVWLTGWIGSGKSTFWKWLDKFSEDLNLNIHYLNLDEITNEIHTKIDENIKVYQITRNKLAQNFWSDILKIDWTTNKKKLWEIVFNNSEKMSELMDIMLEPLIYFLKKKINNINTPWIILVEWAIIFDRGLTYLFDENIINIWVSIEKQRERIMQRDWFTKKQAELRLKNQISKNERINWIKEIQSKYNDRFFLDINWDNYEINNVYNEIKSEYKNRAKLFWKQ